MKSCATPPCQLPNGLHLLCLPKCLLGIALVGPVQHDPSHADGLSVVAILRTALRGDPANGAVLAADPAFEIEETAVDGAREGGLDQTPVLREGMGHEIRLAPRRQRLVIAEDGIVTVGAPGRVMHQIKIP